MPNTTSAKKALRQNTRRRVKNIARKQAYKDAIKAYKKFLGAKDQKAAQEELRKIYKALDKAAKTNAIKKNKASRLKSRLAAKLPKK